MFFPCKLEEGEDSQNIAAMPEYRGWSLEVCSFCVPKAPLSSLVSSTDGKKTTGAESAGLFGPRQAV